MDFHKVLDARGLKCPLPILKAKKALADMASGDVLRVQATDPGSVRDFNAFARQTRHIRKEGHNVGCRQSSLRLIRCRSDTQRTN